VPEETHDYEGQLATYNPGGYITTLNTNGTATMLQLRTLQESNFIDLQSRAIFVDFNVWNTNMGFFGTVKLVGEKNARTSTCLIVIDTYHMSIRIKRRPHIII
jgi:hypothetical protein